MSELFKKYYSRLAKEGMIKSLLWGLIIGSSALTATAITFWLVEPKYFWISFIVWAVVTFVSTVIFYFKKYRPSTEKIAARLDRLGLDERMITMHEFKNDISFIASKQRDDAKETLKKVGASSIRFRIAKGLIVAASIVFAVGAGASTVSGLAKIGVVPSGSALIDEILPDEPIETVSVSYIVLGGAFIEGGSPEQIIEKGGSTEAVNLVAEDGWVFIGWDDGFAEPTRKDDNVMEDVVYTAIFLDIEFPPGPGGPGEGDGEPGDGEPSDGEGSSKENTDDEGSASNKGGGSYEPSNQIIDGTSYYRDHDRYAENYDEVIQLLENGGKTENGEEFPPELLEVLDYYYQMLN